MAIVYARLLNQLKFKYHLFFSAILYEINEEDQRSVESELFINLKNYHKLTETDIKNSHVKSQLEHQFQIQGTKEKGWIVDKFISMKKDFTKLVN